MAKKKKNSRTFRTYEEVELLLWHYEKKKKDALQNRNLSLALFFGSQIQLLRWMVGFPMDEIPDEEDDYHSGLDRFSGFEQ